MQTSDITVTEEKMMANDDKTWARLLETHLSDAWKLLCLPQHLRSQAA